MDWIKRLFKKEPFISGALIDPGVTVKSYEFKEIVASANPVEWIEKPESTWRKFPIFNQDGSGSCVAQSMAKLLGILYWLKNQAYVHFSATHVYQRRTNKPDEGMGGVDAFDIAREGVTLEELVPSQNMSESEMNSIFIPEYKKEVGKIFKIGNYVVFTNPTIDDVASTIQTTGKGVMVWFYFKIDEWTNVPTIKYPELQSYEASRHSVTAVDYTLYGGKKALIIDDSWGSSYGLAGQRVITEDFFKARNFFAAYPIDFKFAETPVEKPKHTFTKQLEIGMNDAEVNWLQKVLVYEGFFPTNVVPTEYYGAITASGVLKFQLKYAVDNVNDLQTLQGRIVGPKTLAKLNELYS